MFYIYVKRYFKNPVILLSTLVLFGWLIYYLFIDFKMKGSMIFEGLGCMTSVVPFEFFIFMVISYEFFYQQKKVVLRK